MSFKVAVLTGSSSRFRMPFHDAYIVTSPVSDTASKDARADKSGPLIKDLIQPHSYVVAESRIVPDNESVVKAVVATWCSSGNIDWIITTGGTGFGEHDRTPEVRADNSPVRLDLFIYVRNYDFCKSCFTTTISLVAHINCYYRP